MKTIIAGSRKGVHYSDVLIAIENCGWVIEQVVCGEAAGADFFGKRWAESKNVSVIKFPAQWNDLSHPDAIIKTNSFGKKYDARAGIRRNHEMGDYADALIAVWDGSSRGTKDMIEYATKKGLKVFVHIPLRYKMDLDNN
jgi:hypothetical protein